MERTTIHISKELAAKIKKIGESENRKVSQQAEFMLNKQLKEAKKSA